MADGGCIAASRARWGRAGSRWLFFATAFSWDTEWSGVYVAASIDEDLRAYCEAELGEGAWYLAFVPFGFT